MSQRTIVEIDHDFLPKIGDFGPEFKEKLFQAISSGVEEDWKLLEDFGVKRIAQHDPDSGKAAKDFVVFPLG